MVKYLKYEHWFEVDTETIVRESSHPGHKSELEIKTEEGLIQLDFASEEALEHFHQGFREFYIGAKQHYASQKKVA